MPERASRPPTEPATEPAIGPAIEPAPAQATDLAPEPTPDRVALLVNPSSRSAGDQRDQLHALLSGRVAVIDVESDGPEDTVRRVAALRDRVDLVIAAGGDGTLHYAARALAGGVTPLAVIPLGTANDFARTLGLPASIEEAVEVAITGRVVAVDLGCANGVPFLNVAGVGVVEDITDELSPSIKKVLGPLAYVEAAARVGLTAEPFEVELEIEPDSGANGRGARERREILQLLIGNGRYFGPAIEVTPEARADDGALDLCLIEASTSFDKVAAVFHMLRGTHELAEQLDVRQVTRVRVITRELRRVLADGEIIGDTPATFEVVPRALRVKVPAGD